MNQSGAASTMQSSPIARAALLAYVMLIVYASWYPFSGWHHSGLAPWIFLHPTMPQYWSRFDAAINIVGYVPLGFLLVFSLYPTVRGRVAVLLAAVVGAALSCTMESVQTYLPSRVASNLDFLTNTAGVVVGALLGARNVRAMLDHSALARLRARWFVPHASWGLVLLALWPLAQLYPQAHLFGHGQLLPIMSEWLSDLLDRNIDLVALMRSGAAMTAEQYWLSETIITACGMCGALLTMLCLLRRSAPRWPLTLALLGCALLVKALATALLFTPENALVWVTPGAQGGFLIGLIMLSGLAFAPHAAQRRLAILTLSISLLVLNTIPVNPYFTATLQGWVQGKFLNFNGAAKFLSLLWPLFALFYLSQASPAARSE